MERTDEPFLTRFKTGPAGKTVWASWSEGFLCLAYDDEGLVQQAAWVLATGQDPRGDELQLWFDWANDMVTFKTEYGMSGTCWSDGHVTFGTVWDQDDGDGGQGEKIGLEAWIDRCIERMRGT